MAAIWMGSGGAHAMQFSTIPLGNSQQVVIGAVGEILPGDLARLAAHLITIPDTVRLYGFILDSPGGNIIEAQKIAAAFHRIQATVGVIGQSKCTSACFLLFAAGARRLVSSTALIGVHSASEGGAETASSMAMTTVMARDAATFGVPLSIVGKIVSAEPGQMEWLTQRDLRSMGATIIEPATAPASVANKTSPPIAPQQMAPGAAATPPVANHGSPAFQQGLGDRQSWEQWLASLSGFYLSGSTFWAAHRSDPGRPSCNASGAVLSGASSTAFMDGCKAAQSRLAASDLRRKNDPDYRQGWNSY